MECLVPHKHTLKILYKLKHIPPRYKRKREWVFLSDVQTKQTPIHIFFYISVENVSICTKFSGYVCEELGSSSKSKFNIHCYCWLANILSNVYLLSWNRLFRNHVNMTSSIVKPIISQKYKNDVRITSSVAMNIYFLRPQNTQFLTNILWKFGVNLNIFHGDIKENVNGCFFLNTVYNIQSTTAVPNSRWICDQPHWKIALFVGHIHSGKW